MALPLIVNGLNITDWVDENQGYAMGYVDREGSNSKTMLDGSSLVDRLARKFTITVKLVPLDEDQLKSLVTAITPDYIPVSYFNLRTASEETATYITEPISSAKYVIDDSTGKHWFKGISLRLTEK